MVEIVTLFLGLVSGPQTVELEVGPPATAVELRLDGELVGRRASPPWRLEIDLGEALAPHELVAVARDESGRQLASARRWINIDLAPAELAGELPPGGVTALPVGFAAGRVPPPEEMEGWFRTDGRPLIVHGVREGRAEVVVVQDPATRPRLEELARLFLGYQIDRLGIPAKPARSDSPGWNPEILRLPREEFLSAALVVFDIPAGAPESLRISRLWQRYHDFSALGDRTVVRFISPVAAPVSRSSSERFVFAGSAGVADVGLFWLAKKLPPMGFARRIADAVAIAGREAWAGGRRRAVVLLLDGEAEDQSLHSVPVVRGYLRALRVPLFVWTLSRGATPTGWEETAFIGLEASGRGGSIRQADLGAAFERFDEAAGALRRELASQRIVLLGGEHLPQRVEIAGPATAARPTGLEPPPAAPHGGPR